MWMGMRLAWDWGVRSFWCHPSHSGTRPSPAQPGHSRTVPGYPSPGESFNPTPQSRPYLQTWDGGCAPVQL